MFFYPERSAGAEAGGIGGSAIASGIGARLAAVKTLVAFCGVLAVID